LSDQPVVVTAVFFVVIVFGSAGWAFHITWSKCCLCVCGCVSGC